MSKDYPRIDRNSEAELQKDIDFIEEIYNHVGNVGETGEALGLLNDWKDELLSRKEELKTPNTP